MKEFIKQNWIAIVATLGLIQPWLIGLWKKFFRKGMLMLYPSGSIEVGFSEFGPTIGLQGTIKADSKDVFVTYIDLKITKMKNDEKHNFVWAAFRSPRINLGSPTETDFEVPSSFIIKVEQPHRFVITFSDVSTQSGILPYIENCRRVLNEIQNEYITELLAEQIETPEEIQKDISEKYRKHPTVTEAFSELSRKVYWDEGRYKLDIAINTDKKTFRFTYHFDITKEDYERLKLNALTMLLNPLMYFLRQAPFRYNFAYCNYNK